MEVGEEEESEDREERVVVARATLYLKAGGSPAFSCEQRVCPPASGLWFILDSTISLSLSLQEHCTSSGSAIRVALRAHCTLSPLALALGT